LLATSLEESKVSSARHAENKLLEAREPASTGQDTEEILNEKSELEKKLETALSDRDALEKDLRKKHEQDQNELFQEAGAKMKGLREGLGLGLMKDHPFLALHLNNVFF